LALSVLDALPRNGENIFARTGNTSVQAWTSRFCEREKIIPAFTPHDLRRTAATRCGDLGVAPHVVEKLLNHRMQGVMAAYNRAEYEGERVAATQAWATELERIVQ
jgi:integrase